MITYTLPPVVDFGPNQQTPIGDVTHFGCVDDEPYDGDATYLRITFAGGREVFAIDPSAIPDDALIVQVRVRSAQKDSTAGQATFKVGVRQFQGATPIETLATHICQAGMSYEVFDDTYPVDPSTGDRWTKTSLEQTLLVHEQETLPGLPSPHLSELVLFVDAVLHPTDARAEGVSSLSPGVGPLTALDPTEG